MWDGAGMGLDVFLLEVRLACLLGMNAGCLGILLVEMGGRGGFWLVVILCVEETPVWGVSIRSRRHGEEGSVLQWSSWQTVSFNCLGRLRGLAPLTGYEACCISGIWSFILSKASMNLVFRACVEMEGA